MPEPLVPEAALAEFGRFVARRAGALIAGAGPAGPFVATTDAAALSARLAQGGAEAPLCASDGALRDGLLAQLCAPETTTGLLFARLGLPGAAMGLLALGLLSERDAGFATLYAYLGDDMLRRAPTPALARRLLGEAYAPDPLLRWALVTAEADPLRPVPDRQLRPTDALAARLLGREDWARPDPALEPHLLQAPRVPLALLLPASAPQAEGRGALAITGPEGAGRLALAVALAEAAGQEVLALDIAGFMAEGGAPALALREARRLALRPVLAGAEGLGAADLARILHLAPDTIFVAAAPLARGADGRRLPEIALPPLDRARSRALWHHALGPHMAPLAAELAHRFRLPLADILAVGAQAPPEAGELTRACLARAPRTLDRLAQRLHPPQEWDDLILPERQKAQIAALIARVTHARQVHEDWGFGQKLAPERGLTALFAGPSGTGKSLSAGIVAARLGLALYRVDLSATVSKYIGETEKQLEQIFTAAEAAHACLFFDECDALFGKRSEVSDAHDRYANIETSYLLQRLELHRGVVILASNHPQNIDDAFTRRIDLRVEFGLPDAEARVRLWARLLPPEAGAEIDTEMLGQSFELSGGAIRNCLITAAFLAAEEGVRIGMAHCLRAVALEYEKSGRPLTRAEFGAAYPRLRGGTGR